MPDIDDLQQEVDDLIANESNDFEFRHAYQHIDELSRTATDNDLDKLRSILSSFRLKLPNRETLNRVNANARDLQGILVANSLDERIARINARNGALADLAKQLSALNGQIQDDAGLLSTIKNAVDKATSTVGEVKDLVDQLHAADGIKNQLKVLIDAVNTFSSIFHPQNT